MMTPREEIRGASLCLGQAIGRWTITDFDMEPRIPAGGMYVGFTADYERRIIRRLPLSECWLVSAYTRHPMGWLNDGSESERAATFAEALEMVRGA